MDHIKNRIKVLYVDDEQYNLNAFYAYFRVKKEFEIFTCRSGEEGLEVLRREFIHILISDQRMPHMTGVEFLEKVTTLPSDPVKIVVTAHRDIYAIEKAYTEGKIFAYLDKPWYLDAVETLILKGYEEYKRRNPEMEL